MVRKIHQKTITNSSGQTRKIATKSERTTKSTSYSSSSKSNVPVARNVNSTLTWKGDPNNTAAIKAWEHSFEPGYKPEIISPRDKNGNYTSDSAKTVGYITMDKETHAKEIAIALQSEPNIPTSIIDYLKKTLAKTTEGIVETNPPIAQTQTNATKDESAGRNLTDMTSSKFGALIVGLLVMIFFLLKLNETR